MVESRENAWKKFLIGFWSASAILLTSAPAHAAVCPIGGYFPSETPAILEVPTSRAAAKAMRRDYLSGIKEATYDLKEIIEKKHPERHAEKITKLRKFFVMFRHYSELYTREGKLPESVEKLAFLPGKVVDALSNEKAKKAERFIDRLEDALSEKQIRQMFKEVKELKVASEAEISRRIEGTVAEIKELSSRDVLNFEEFHDMKKAIRRFVYIQKYRVKLRGESRLKELNRVQDELIKQLSKTTDEIAEMKLEIDRAELEKVDFTVSPELREKISSFLGTLKFVSDF